jgi:hypothetical protein
MGGRDGWVGVASRRYIYCTEKLLVGGIEAVEREIVRPGGTRIGSALSCLRSSQGEGPGACVNMAECTEIPPASGATWWMGIARMATRLTLIQIFLCQGPRRLQCPPAFSLSFHSFS